MVGWKCLERVGMKVFINEIYTGIRYQCVELARRYYLTMYRTVFEDVPVAKDIYGIKYLTDTLTGEHIVWPSYPNRKTSPKPIEGSLLIWSNDLPTGHVAVVTKVTDDHVHIIEQNQKQTHRVLPFSKGRIISEGLKGWKMPPSNRKCTHCGHVYINKA